MKKLLFLITATLICAAIPMKSAAQTTGVGSDEVATIEEKDGVLTITTNPIPGASLAVISAQIEGDGVRVVTTKNAFPKMMVSPSEAVVKIIVTVYFSGGSSIEYIYDSW